MAAVSMLRLPASRPAAAPIRGSHRQRAQPPVCSVQALCAAAAVGSREGAHEQQAALDLSGSTHARDAAPTLREGPAAGTAIQSSTSARPAVRDSSPWQTRLRPAALDTLEVEVPVPPASRQASRRRVADPADLGRAVPRQQRSADPGPQQQRSGQAASTASEPQRAPQRQQEQLQRRRKHTATLHSSIGASGRRPAQLQAAVRSNKQHDWQVTRDWLLMEMGGSRLDDDTFEEIAEAAGLPDTCRPQVAFYYDMGLSKRDMYKLSQGRTQLFHLSVPTIQSKLKFLREEAGISDPHDMCKLLIKCPRIVEYKTERTLRPRLDFLRRHQVEHADIPKVVMSQPSLLALSVEHTLEPRIKFLRDVACVPEDSMSKLLVKSPAVLTCTEASMQQRVDFLRRAGFDDVQMAKAVVAFPQILYLKVEAMEARVQYLRAIGVDAGQLAQVVTKLPQLLSLDIANNMAPKFEYLRSELGGNAQTIAGYPHYFSLSMPQRIVPRHRFLQMVQPKQHWPFPIAYLKVTDQLFASTVANRPLGEFQAFRSSVAAEFAARSRPGAFHHSRAA